jgi:hypothetical protein
MSTARIRNGGLPPLPTPGRSADRRVVELEGVEGAISLARLLDALHRAGHRLPVHVAVYITHEVARALRHLHEGVGRQGQPPGRVHGSVNGHNVLLLRSGRVKLIARSTLPAQGDRHADLHMLGLAAWEMLVGWPPDGESPGRALVPPSALRPDLPNAIDALVLRALERDPRRRYSSAGSLARDTAIFLATRPDPRRGLRLLLTQVIDGPATADPSSVTRQTRVPWRDGSGALPALPPPPPPPSARVPEAPVSAPSPTLSLRTAALVERRPWLGRLGIFLFQAAVAALLAGAALLALGLVRRADPAPGGPAARGTLIVPLEERSPSAEHRADHHARQR